MSQLSLLDIKPQSPVEAPKPKPAIAPPPPLATQRNGKTHNDLAREIQATMAIASNGEIAGYVLYWCSPQPIGVSVRGRFYHWNENWKIISEGDRHAS